MLGTVNLGGNFSKEEQQEREQHRHEEELHPLGRAEIHQLHKEIVEQHDNGHVHQIVADQDGGQQTLVVVAQVQDFGIRGVFTVLHLIKVGRGKAEESYLRGRHESRAQKQPHGYGQRNPSAQCGHTIGNGFQRLAEAI